MKLALKTFFTLAKESLLILIYAVIMGILAIFVVMVKNTFLRNFLYFLVFAFFLMLIFIFTRTTGEKQYKNLLTGNIRRSKEDEEDIKKYCKPHEEYKLYKGFLITVISFLPLFLLLLLSIPVKANFIGYTLKIGYAILYMPLSAFKDGVSMYFLLIPAAVCIAVSGFGYYFGAKKIMLQQERLQQTHDMIYGKKD